MARQRGCRGGSGKPVGAPLQDQGPVVSAAFSPDGRRVVTASADKTARVWDVLLECCASQNDADRLASLAEAVSGYEVSDTGSLTFIGLDEQRKRLRELGRLSGTGASKELTLEWIVRRFAAGR